MQPVIYADLRCLQDRDYQRRGIGYHTSALLRARANSAFAEWRTVGIIDPRMPPVPDDLASVVDEVSASCNPSFNGNQSIFIDGSPMTHETRFSLRIQHHPNVLRAAVLYDFIPLDWPGYLPLTSQRIEYSAKIARLAKFDAFFPISYYTASRLQDLLGVPAQRVVVTGACVRKSLYEARLKTEPIASPYEQPQPYFVTLGGDDRRKNTDIAVKAVKHLNLLYDRSIPLKVIGFYCDAYKADLLRQAGHPEGQGFLEFFPHIPDAEVVKLHLGAMAAICPSRIEGFSLPVAEAAVCSCPVISSTCSAQLELVTQPDALFHSEDYSGLSTVLERILNRPEWRESLVASQSHLAREFHADAVGNRFWSGLENYLGAKANAVSPSRKPTIPRLALLTPFPPDTSVPAIYAAGILKAADGLFDCDLFTDANRPLATPDGAVLAEGSRVSVAPMLDGAYNSVVSVLGNAPGQSDILGIFNRFGGPCILHDFRLLRSYFELLGPDGFCHLASELQRRPIALAEAEAWLRDPNCTLTFLDKVVARASPLIVQTRTHQRLLKERYGVESPVATCCPTIETGQPWSAAKSDFLRAKLGLSPEAFVVSTFGRVGRTLGMDVCIIAIDLLRSWNIPAELYFVGDCAAPCSEIERVAGLYDVSPFVHCHSGLCAEDTYSDFLLAADTSLQLRDYDFGQPSYDLINAICAGLPAVATADMHESCDAPSFVRAVPDRFSPLQVAEALALMWETRRPRDVHEDERLRYEQTHNFHFYAARLIDILGLR